MDYIQRSATAVFTMEYHEVCVNVSTLQDHLVETLETFTVVLESVDPSVIFNPSTLTGNIWDDDCKIAISVSLIIFFDFYYELDPSVVTIDLDQEHYTVAEEEGYLEVCLEAVNTAQLAHAVTVTLITLDALATG